MNSDGAAWIEAVLRAAAADGVSDLALEPQDDGALLAMLRADGVRRAHDRCPPALAGVAVNRLKALAGIPGYVTDEPQDGRIDGRPFGIPGDVRLAVLPTVRGPRVALRLPALGELPVPEDLGFEPVVLAALRSQLRRPDGLVLISGPTGSGKTTTIHSLLRELAAERADRVLLSIEDPVERRVAGIDQVEVRPTIGFGFLEALRASLRQDADVIAVGEIRDTETATAALRAALGGHLVVATVHAPRAREVVPRLLEMGVQRELLLPALRAVLAQRLIRQRHPDCAGAGCSVCGDGFAGRRPVVDLLICHPAVRAALAAGEAPGLRVDMDQEAAAQIASQRTTEAECRRVLAGC